MKPSIVIPAFGNQDSLDKSLATLRDQPFHEVIVVDDGSDPPLRVPGWVFGVAIDRPPVHRGSSVAKNFGALMATGDLLIFADSDILHLPDAVDSIRQTYEDWGSEKLLLNTNRAGLPQHYPASWTEDLEVLYTKCEVAGLIKDTSLLLPLICYEQNFGAISKDYFTRLGGYDEESFPSWGFNNQDLDIRVMLDGGEVSSAIPRANGERLYCFHMWHENNCDKEQAEAEFVAKWGEPFSRTFVNAMKLQPLEPYKDRVYLKRAA